MDDDIDLLALHLARIGKEPSRALPQDHYRDPANMIRLTGESKCEKCTYSRSGKAGKFCGKGKPYGARCEWFRNAKKGNA